MESEYKCQICTEAYDIEDNKPFLLKCGHILCQTCINQIYQEKRIKCPYCKQINKYTNQGEISQNYSPEDILNQLKKDEQTFLKHSSIIKSEKILKTLNNIMKNINKENSEISNHVEDLINKKQQVLKFNKGIMLKINCFKSIIKQSHEKNLLHGITESMGTKIKQDIDVFTSSYIKIKDFICEQKLNLSNFRTKKINQSKMLNDYCSFIDKSIYAIDNLNRERIKIDKQKLQNLKHLLSHEELTAEEIAVKTWFYIKGYGFQRSDQKARETLQKYKPKLDGRCIFFRGVLTKNPQDIVESSQMGYTKGFTNAAWCLNEFSDDQKKFLLFTASRQLNDTQGSFAEGWKLLNGFIENKEIEGVNSMMKSIEMGLYDRKAKQALDLFYTISPEFQNKYPNYKSWDGDYSNFAKQPYQLL